MGHRRLDRVEPERTRWPEGLLLSVLLHLALVRWLPERPDPPPPPMLVQLLAEPLPGQASAGDRPDAGAGDGVAASEVQARAAPRPPRARATTPPAPVAPVAPSGDVPAPSEAEAQPSAQPLPRFAAWQSARDAGLPGLGPRAATTVGLGGEGPESIRSQGTDRCVPRGTRRPELLYLLIDSSGSMSPEWQAQALTCAHQYIDAALAAGALVSVANFAERLTFTTPGRDRVALEVELRNRTNGVGTRLPGRDLWPLLDAHAHLDADLVVLSDGQLPNHHEAMTAYRYFLDVNRENRAYLYTIGLAAPGEVIEAFSLAGFTVLTYRAL